MIKNKKLFIISGLVLTTLFAISLISVKAETTLCSFTGPDLSEDLLRLTDFSVTGPSSLKEGDTIIVKFKLQNYGQSDLKLGSKGIFTAARDPNNNDASFGFIRSNTTLKYAETVSIEVSRVLDKTGTWKIWPSYHLSLATGEELGPNEWHVCTLNVGAKIIDSDQDGIQDQQDNCPQNYNPKQEDIDKDGIGDACDPCDDRDSDQDGIKNCLDKCPDQSENYNQYQDDDGCPDEKPKEIKDSDKDGIPDEKDKCSKEPEIFNNYQDDDGCPDSLPEIKPEVKTEVKPEIKKETKPPKISLTLTPSQPKAGERTKIKVKASDESPIKKIVIFLNKKPVKKCSQADYCQTEFVFMMGYSDIFAAAIDFHNNISARDITGRDFRLNITETDFRDLIARDLVRELGLDFNDNDNDGEFNSFDNCLNVSNPDQQDTDSDGVGNACDECDPIKEGRFTDPERFLLELLEFYIDDTGCGISDTDYGLSYYTQGEIRKQKKDRERSCEERRIGIGPPIRICYEPTIETVATDSCLDDTRVREYYIVNPSAGEFGYQDFNCPYGCQDGACICEGSDSDGGRNYYRQGCLSGTDCNLRENQDQCLGDYQLREFYRERRINERGEEVCQMDVEIYNCPIGCQDGACVCQDSDGGINYDTRGHVGQAGADYCQDERNLVEYEAVWDRSRNTCFTPFHVHRCEGSCSQGHCVPPTCDDGIQNQGETNIDCGGPCPIACNQVRISGRILYEEADAHPGYNAPVDNGQGESIFKSVRLAKVKLGSSSGLTDSNGYFSFVISRRPGTQYKLEVRPTNYAARVERDYDACNEYVWWVKDGISIPEVGNVNLGELKIGINTNMDFSGYWQEPEHSCFLFGLAWCACGGNRYNINGGSAYFNIAETILLTREYANANRADSDSIGQVDVAYPDPTIHGMPWANPFWGEIYLPEFYNGRDLGFLDVVIIHEYAHHLTEEISENDWALSEHTLCSAIDREFAWFEGFAHYLSLFLTNQYRDPSLFPERFLSQETTFYNFAESPDCRWRSLNIEGVILAGLWDMVDIPGAAYPESIRERFDLLGGQDALIFHIFDTAMDNIVDAPDICEFIWGRNGLRARLSDDRETWFANLQIFERNIIICPTPGLHLR